jgi:hypothetical protein
LWWVKFLFSAPFSFICLFVPRLQFDFRHQNVLWDCVKFRKKFLT